MSAEATAPEDRTKQSPENRIRLLAALIGGAAALVAWALRGGPAGVGVALGAGLSVLNYAWLQAGAVAFTQAAVNPGDGASNPVGLGLLRFLARFLLLGICLCAIFISHLVPLVMAVAGLFAVPAAALFEGVSLLLAPN